MSCVKFAGERESKISKKRLNISTTGKEKGKFRFHINLKGKVDKKAVKRYTKANILDTAPHTFE